MQASQETTKKKGKAQSIDSYVGERLKEIRKMQKLTQENLAEKVGVSFQQIQKYENGKNRMSVGRLHEFSKLLKTPLEAFFEGYVPEGNAALYGMSDNEQEILSGYDAANTDAQSYVSKKEIDELIQLYYSLENPKLRKSFLNLVKHVADNLKIQDDE